MLIKYFGWFSEHKAKKKNSSNWNMNAPRARVQQKFDEFLCVCDSSYMKLATRMTKKAAAAAAFYQQRVKYTNKFTWFLQMVWRLKAITCVRVRINYIKRSHESTKRIKCFMMKRKPAPSIFAVNQFLSHSFNAKEVRLSTCLEMLAQYKTIGEYRRKETEFVKYKKLLIIIASKKKRSRKKSRKYHVVKADAREEDTIQP